MLEDDGRIKTGTRSTSITAQRVTDKQCTLDKQSKEKQVCLQLN